MPLKPKMTFNDREKHLVQTLESMTKRSGERVVYKVFLDAVDWDQFRYPEIVKALESLVNKKLISRDDSFVIRHW
jgi:hypothetical protein